MRNLLTRLIIWAIRPAVIEIIERDLMTNGPIQRAAMPRLSRGEIRGLVADINNNITT